MIALGLASLPFALHVSISRICAFEAPSCRVFDDKLRIVDPSLRRIGNSYVREIEGLTLAHLEGDGEQIGWASGKLMRDSILETESRLFAQFEHYVPKAWARILLLDWAKIRYSQLDQNLDTNARKELAALGLALQPDPFQSFIPAYQRLVYLSGLYDISLSFEHAPMVGCTTFVVHGSSSDKSHSWLARNFDFEVDEIFDQKKILYLMFEAGKVPYASIAWPGLPGVVSGMNANGLALVVHGGRAGSFDVTGEPVLQTMRSVMGQAQSIRDAVEILRQKKPMISHIVVVTDPSGESVVIERVPRETPYVYKLAEKAVVTNHFIGPAADDPRNLRVRDKTTSVYRQQRGQQLLSRIHHPFAADDLVGLLRERRGLNDEELPLGDRRAIGALIAAHGVVFDTTARKIWVSMPPHLLGRFVEFHLDELLTGKADSETTGPSSSISPDPFFTSGQYQRWSESKLRH